MIIDKGIADFNSQIELTPKYITFINKDLIKLSNIKKHVTFQPGFRGFYPNGFKSIRMQKITGFSIIIKLIFMVLTVYCGMNVFIRMYPDKSLDKSLNK